VLANAILQSPKDWERGNSNEHSTTGAKNAAYLAKSFHIIVNMFDDVRCKHQIKALVSERHVACITLPNNSKAFFPAVADCFLAEIQSICSLKAEVAQKPEIGARRSANIENSTGTRQPGLIYLPREEATTAHEPPMGGFCLSLYCVRGDLH